MEALLTLSIALFAGLMLSRLAKVLKLPAVTAYLIAGILVGPFVLGRLGWNGIGFIPGSFDLGTSSEKLYSTIADVALGFIAFSIGNEFRLTDLKHTGKKATVIGIFQAVTATVLVDAALISLSFIIPDNRFPLPAAIILGAIASATAPAATLMVVRQYKAKGPLTDLLLPIVALDDAVGLILFAVSFGVAKAISTSEISLLSIVLEPILEVILSLALGFVMGMLFTFFERFFHSRSKRLAMSVTFVLLTVALSMWSKTIPIFGTEIHIGFSSLLVCMMLGTVFCNACDFSEELMDRVDRWTAPLFVIFFVISGAELELSVFTDWMIVLVGVVYILFRSCGKYFGAFFSAKFMKCEKSTVKYLGITLLPQAGVALGMAIKASVLQTNNIGSIVTNITLFGVLIYEIVGPMLTKISLVKAGEVQPDGKVSARTLELKRLLHLKNHKDHSEHKDRHQPK